MAGYKEIKGFQVQTRSEDPVPYAQALANNPYVGVWSAGGTLNTARAVGAAGSGTLTSGLAISGDPVPSPISNVEQYNGSSWTEITDVNTARYDGAGVGTTAPVSLFIGGYTTTSIANTESWNGSAWTEVNDLNTARFNASAFGTYTSSVLCGGFVPPISTSIESWDGSSWTEIA